MPYYCFDCPIHGRVERVLPITADLDNQTCGIKSPAMRKCVCKLEHVFAQTAPPKLVGGGFHATEYHAPYKGK
jgi:hypothetical protein